MRGFCATAKRRETSSSFRRRSGRRLRVIISRNAHHATTTSTRTRHVRLATVRATRTRASAFEARGASARPRRFEGTPGSGIRAERRSARSVRPTQPPTTRSSARAHMAALLRGASPAAHQFRKDAAANRTRQLSDSRLARRLRAAATAQTPAQGHRAEYVPATLSGRRSPRATSVRGGSGRTDGGRRPALRAAASPARMAGLENRRRARRVPEAAVAAADARRGGAEAR